MRPYDSIFARIFQGVGGGKRIAVLISAYFDESSEADSKSGILAVCGYALDETGVRQLSRSWQRMLSKYGLPYFHMTECNSNTGIFEQLNANDCDRCARKAIKLARKYPLHGHAYSLDQSQYREILQNRGFDCDPYTFLVWTAFIHVYKWVHKNKPDYKISLYFEKGYETESRANELLKAALHDPFVGGIPNRVTSFSFVKKEDSEPTQAGDLVAWHVRRGFQHERQKRGFRKDTLALIEDRHIFTVEFNAERLEGIRDDFVQKAGSLENAARLLFSPSGAAVVSK
jgi:hypothetical protein